MTIDKASMMGAGEEGELERSPPAHLPGDILYGNVLPRLPYRSLTRCASVCKSWREFILRDAAFAARQARTPTRASAALARFHNGRLEVLAGADASAVAPPDPCFSSLPANVEFCACANGLLCLTAAMSPAGRSRAFYVVNPARPRTFHDVPYNGRWKWAPDEGGVKLSAVAGLAYDPAAAAAQEEEGYHLVVAFPESGGRRGFATFSSRAAGSGWRASRSFVELQPYEKLHQKPAYAGGRVHWLSELGRVVWYDVAGDLCGKVEPPVCKDGGESCLKGNWDLGAARGGTIRLAGATGAGVGVWELAGYDGAGASPPARWELAHWRSWSRIPGVVKPWSQGCFLWSAVPTGTEPGEDGAIGLALRVGHVLEGTTTQVWRRELVRYDPRTGETAAALELAGKEVHDGFGTVFGYHSSMAPLPGFNLAA